MSQILHMMRKEFKQIFRDPPMIAIIFIVPILQLFVLAYTITTDVRHIKMGIIDYDNSIISREIIQSFNHTEQFDIVRYSENIYSISEEMRAWDIQFALVIPKNFSRDMYRRLNPQIQLIVDGVDGNTAGVALGYAQQILSEFGTSLVMQRKQTALPLGNFLTMIERMWYNLELDSKQYMIPGIVVMLLTIIPMMLSAMSLVREKEIGTLEQLMVTPLKKHQLLLGKITPFLILAYIELTLVMTFAIVVFNINMEGSVPVLGMLAFLYLFTTIGLGIFTSTITSSQQQAMFVAWFMMVFMILMSGFFIPIENMPSSLQKLTYLNPMRYFMYIVRDLFQKGSGLKSLYVDVIPMAFFGIIIFSLGVLNFRKKVS
jgi:ABC-2 type transport system permease protein